MRHRKSKRKFSRTAAHRSSMFRNMATELLRNEFMETTVEKAKDLRGYVEKLITLAGENTLSNRRLAASKLKDKAVLGKLFSDIGPRYKSRNGGYTRVIRTKVRAGDAAEMALIELVGRVLPEPRAKAEAAGETASQ